MKKLKLELDTLRVVSFEPVPETREPRGTVRGRMMPADESSCGQVCTCDCGEATFADPTVIA